MTSLDLDVLHDLGGIAVPSFFNGRILSAEDLRLLLESDRKHRRLIGRAIGPGVADGLRVGHAGGSRLDVTAGLAINGYGETIDLPTDVELDIGRPTKVVGISSGIFVECHPDDGNDDDGTRNAFILTVRPDSEVRGSAPSDVVTSGSSCGPGFVSEGVRFRRVPVNPNTIALALGSGAVDPLTAGGRNRMAHALLGSPSWLAVLARPADPDAVTTVQRSLGIEDCEVALALFVMAGKRVDAVDEWSVRRLCAQPIDHALGMTEPVLGAARRATGLAAQLQFQHHLAAVVVDEAAPQAATHVPWLPGAGVLPAELLGTTSTAIAFANQDTLPFFGPLARLTSVEIRLGDVERILRHSVEMPAISLDRGPVEFYTVALIADTKAERRAVFFRDDHPFRTRIELEELTERVRLLEIEPPPPEQDDRSVSVWFAPSFERTRRFGLAPADTPFEMHMFERTGGDRGRYPQWVTEAVFTMNDAEFERLAEGEQGSWSSADESWYETIREFRDANRGWEIPPGSHDGMQPVGSNPASLAWGATGYLEFAIQPNRSGIHTVRLTVSTDSFFPMQIWRLDGERLEHQQDLPASRSIVRVAARVNPPIVLVDGVTYVIKCKATSTVDPSVSDSDTIKIQMVK